MGFDAGDSNLYRYVNNRPTMATDPSGQDIYLMANYPHYEVQVDSPTGKRTFWYNTSPAPRLLTFLAFSGHRIIWPGSFYGRTYRIVGAVSPFAGIFCLPYGLALETSGIVMAENNDGKCRLAAYIKTNAAQDAEFFKEINATVGGRGQGFPVVTCRNWARVWFGYASGNFGPVVVDSALLYNL